ncbi:abortive infection family protein [Pseudomonas syringae pv. tomato]|nr:abortive infection family protein [Pseudomonas syringae pv. tomato]MBW8020427.1 hypothetical protein [Pseudomonas syringae pv. tomato]
MTYSFRRPSLSRSRPVRPMGETAPSQHIEEIFKQILGGCTSVLKVLGALRNRLGNSHCTGKAGVKPAPIHGEFEINLARSLPLYLLSKPEAKAPLTD